MVTLKNHKTGEEEFFFPIDARDLLLRQSGDYSLVEDGAIEGNRMNPKPFAEAAALGKAKVKETSTKDEPAKNEPAKAPTPAPTQAAKAA
jgi:hypothetical protein